MSFFSLPNSTIASFFPLTYTRKPWQLISLPKKTASQA